MGTASDAGQDAEGANTGLQQNTGATGSPTETKAPADGGAGETMSSDERADHVPAELQAFHGEATAAQAEQNLETILDIPVSLSLEIGRTKISIRNLLQLNPGSVVELDRLEGEPLDVLVNGTLVAHGEVVVVNDKFGIRVTDVISAQERVTKLR